MDKKDKVEALQADLENLKDLFSRKVNNIEKQISDLSTEDDILKSVPVTAEASKIKKEIIEEPVDSIAASIETPKSKPEILIESESPDIEEPVIAMNEQKTNALSPEEKEVSSGGPSWTPPAEPQIEEPKKPESKTDRRWTSPVPQEDGWTSPNPDIPREPMPSFSEMFTSLFLFIFTPLAAPIQALFPQVFSLYKKFKEEERLSIFFLTAGGVIATILGFVYLLQYSFSNYLSEFAKIILGYGVATAIIFIGWKVTNKSEKFKDYGASLIGLGITLNYVCTYFISSYFNFVGDAGGFVLFGINTIIAYVLALKFETRIVATITYIGGAFSPFLLNGEMDSAGLYLSYLLLLSGAALHLSREIKWISLSYLSFISTIVIFESILFGLKNAGSVNLLMTGLIHAFFYMYVYYALFSNKSLTMRKSLKKEQIAIFCGSITLYLVNLYHYIGGGTILGLILIVNSLPFILYVAKNFKRSNEQQRAIMTSSSATLLAIAVPFLFSLDVIGLIWAQESLLLLYLGFVFGSNFIKKEAYAALVLSTGVIVWSIVSNYSLWLSSLLNINTVSLLSIGLLLFISIRIIKKFNSIAHTFDLTMMRIISEALSIWMVITYLLIAHHISPTFMLVSVIVPMLFMLYRGTIFNLSFTKGMGVMLYGLVVVQIGLSMEAVESVRFIQQTLPGKIALIETLVLLAFLQTFFTRLLPESDWLQYTKKLRITFLFIAPFLLLPTIYRRAPEFFPIALWVSFALNYYIAKVSKHSTIQKERVAHYFITIGLCILPIAFAQNTSFYSLSNWPAFIGFGIALFAFHQKFYERILPDNDWLAFTHRLRVAFLFTLPLIFLPAVSRHMPAFLPLGLWLSFALTYFIAKKTKYPLLQKELVVHYFATIAISILSVALSQNAQLFSLSNWPHFVALVIALGAFHSKIYERIIPDNQWPTITNNLRIVSLIAVSFVFIPTFYLFAPQFVPLALWGTFVLNYFIVTRTEYAPLKIELVAHYFISTGAAIFTMINSHTSNIIELDNFPLFLGLALTAVIFMKEGMFKSQKAKDSYLKSAMTAWFYHSCIAITAIIMLVTNRLDAALLALGVYLLVMTLKESRLPAVKNYHAANYLIGMILLGMTTAMQLLSATALNMNQIISAVIGIVSTGVILYVVKNELPRRLALIGNIKTKRENRRVIELWYAQIVVVMLYMALIKMVTGDWIGPVTTIAFVLHGISIIFQSSKSLYKSLTKLAVVMFATACIKIFLYDLKGFTLIQKILVFTVIGVVMLVSAYYFNKMRKVEQVSS